MDSMGHALAGTEIFNDLPAAGTHRRAAKSRVKPGSQRIGEPLTPPLVQSDPTAFGHPTGFMIADAVRYVRAQLETAGLPWTQRDHAGPEVTAREAGKTQLTGYFRRWWQVLVRTNVGLADGFTDRFAPPTGMAAELAKRP
jgi:hypothetical protein